MPFCVHCCKWFSSHTNASGWKVHLKKHNVLAPGSEVGTSASASRLKRQTLSRPAIPDRLLVKFENAVVDFVIQGAISLRAAGSDKFKTLVHTLTQGYEGPSTRTVIRRIVEHHATMLPIVGAFFSNLDVAISLTIDGWSNRNLKGFWMVTVHWIDTKSVASKSLLLMILYVQSRRGVGKRIGTALFEHLQSLGHNVSSKLLAVTSDQWLRCDQCCQDVVRPGQCRCRI
uniref:Uncharacterized protein LOC116950326 n=1 Tax=Petromyzon marinus TaxID=7757 RepID=A0AAJ7X7J3_PETMA|nr:uncharacterized protein LOC116950326 [Petromyzon marinus]